MSFFGKLFGRKPATNFRDEPEAIVAPAPAPVMTPAPVVAPEPQAPEVEAPKEDVNIWDLGEDDNAVMEAVLEPAPKSRRRRNATRLIGFEHTDEDTVDPFAQTASATEQEVLQFPVGWVLVIEGEGRGHCFGLNAGLNQVGRGADNSISLDFGDSAISRNNHFAVVYDDEERKFMLGHGGKSNIVRLNGKAVISNEYLSDGDTIKVGGTVLRLKTLCGPEFDWADPVAEEGQEDVAIA